MSRPSRDPKRPFFKLLVYPYFEFDIKQDKKLDPNSG